MYILDTHVVIWTLSDPSNLSETAKKIILNGDSLYTSILTFWEIQIKKSKGRLTFPYSVGEAVQKCSMAGIKILNIKPSHIDALDSLSHIHGDPFDRLLIAQALSEDMTIITRDEKIPPYGVKTVW